MTDFTFPAEFVETVERQSDGNETSAKMITLKGVDIVRFMEEIWTDELINEFLSNKDILEMFARRIGVEGLFRTYKTEEVCDHITWDYIREYFLDHVDYNDILNHIGWEVVSKHFSDYLDAQSNSTEDINSNESVVEKLNACKGQD